MLCRTYERIGSVARYNKQPIRLQADRAAGTYVDTRVCSLARAISGEVLFVVVFHDLLHSSLIQRNHCFMLAGIGISGVPKGRPLHALVRCYDTNLMVNGYL